MSVQPAVGLIDSSALVDTAREYAHLSTVYELIAAGVFLFVAGLIIATVLRFARRSRGRVSRRSEHNRLEAGYALGLLATVGLLLLLSFHAEARVDTASARERPRLTVDVTGSRWVWTFHYRDQRITEQSGFVGHGALTVPTNQPVRFNLRSSDVIHSFWIPQLDYKRDLIPGTTERVTLDFDRAGWFGGGCAEFCGLHHAEMVFQVHAVTPAQFRAWAASHGGSR